METNSEIAEIIKVFPSIEPGSMIVVRLKSKDPTIVSQLRQGLIAHYGHNDFLVVVLGVNEDLDVIPPHEMVSWIQNRKGYFGGLGGHHYYEGDR